MSSIESRLTTSERAALPLMWVTFLVFVYATGDSVNPDYNLWQNILGELFILSMTWTFLLSVMGLRQASWLSLLGGVLGIAVACVDKTRDPDLWTQELIGSIVVVLFSLWFAAGTHAWSTPKAGKEKK